MNRSTGGEERATFRMEFPRSDSWRRSGEMNGETKRCSTGRRVIDDGRLSSPFTRQRNEEKPEDGKKDSFPSTCLRSFLLFSFLGFGWEEAMSSHSQVNDRNCWLNFEQADRDRPSTTERKETRGGESFSSGHVEEGEKMCRQESMSSQGIVARDDRMEQRSPRQRRGEERRGPSCSNGTCPNICSSG